MKERPIIMSAESVRGILAGRKSVTRRVVKPQPDQHKSGYWWYGDKCFSGSVDLLAEVMAASCANYQVGSIAWVRESCAAEELPSGLDGVRYCADDAFRPIENTRAASDAWCDLYAYRGGRGRIVPPIFTPRWASRLTLEITAVRVERLNQIDYRDVLREGIGDVYKAPEQLLPAFAHHWDRLNSHRPGCSWNDNPFVFVISFRRVQPGIEPRDTLRPQPGGEA